MFALRFYLREFFGEIVEFNNKLPILGLEVKAKCSVKCQFIW